MANFTTNFNLKKPLGGEVYNIEDDNGNMDLLDTALTNTYTKTQIDNLVSAVYKFKGSVANFASLPSTGQTTGDVWNVTDTGINYAWAGSVWDDIGGVEALATASNDGLMSSSDFAKLLAITGTNTGDETLATIKTKLGVTTLSGANTGDQTLPTLSSLGGAPLASPTFTGTVTAPTNTSYTTRQVRNVVLSTADASGGSNGDIWFKYTP